MTEISNNIHMYYLVLKISIGQHSAHIKCLWKVGQWIINTGTIINPGAAIVRFLNAKKLQVSKQKALYII